jgi:hypothetical protein
VSDALPIVDLPQHVAEADEWQRWPRKVDAHLPYAVRARQVQSFCRSGRLKVYQCPDGSLRLDPDQLRAEFGEPGELTGRERDLPKAEREQRRRRPGEREPDTIDPLAFMFRETVGLLRDTHRELLSLVKSIDGPMASLLTAYERQHALMSDRIKLLEQNADEAATLRSELADASQERDIALARHKASEARRDQTLALLKDQVPSLVKRYLDGDSFAAWVQRTPRPVIEALLDGDTLSPADADQIRRAAGIPKPPTPPTQPNGASSHGNS